MKLINPLSKDQIQKYSLVVGYLGLFYCVISKTYKSDDFRLQELSFGISILSIIALSIGLNLKLQQKNEDNQGFVKRNTPLMVGLIVSIFLIGFWTINNYLI